MTTVERFKQDSMNGLSGGTNKCRCREVAVSGGSTVIKSDFPVLLTLLNK